MIWISVNDELPPAGEEVLVWICKFGNVKNESQYHSIMHRYNNHWQFMDYEGNFQIYDNYDYQITHWSKITSPTGIDY